MKRSWFGAAAAAAVCTTAACNADAGPPGMIVRDSTGVRVVEYREAPVAAETLALSAEPTYRQGHRPGDHLFAGIVGGALLANGGAVLVDGSPLNGQVVLLIGPDGALRATLARAGQGPAEVIQVGSLTVVGGDTVIVEDDPNAKFLFFADTALVRNVSTRADPTVRGLRVEGVDGAGRLLMVQSGYRQGFSEPWLQGALVALELEALRADTVASFDMASAQPAQGPANPFGPFGRAAVSGGRFVLARSDLPELLWRGPDGALEQILRWTPSLRYPTEGEAETFFESMAADLRRVNPDAPDGLVQQMAADQRARSEIRPDVPYPLFRNILGTDDGGVWLAEFQPISNPFLPIARYTVVDGDGTWLGSVEMPERFRALDVAGGRVLGVLTDEMGVESVAVFELRREPAPRG